MELRKSSYRRKNSHENSETRYLNVLALLDLSQF